MDGRDGADITISVIILLSYYLDGTEALPSFKANHKYSLNLAERERVLIFKAKKSSKEIAFNFIGLMQPVVVYGKIYSLLRHLDCSIPLSFAVSNMFGEEYIIKCYGRMANLTNVFPLKFQFYHINHFTKYRSLQKTQ